MDGNVVGVAFDAQIVRRVGNGGRDLAERGQGLRLGSGRAGVKEAGFAEADDQAILAHLDGNGVGGDLA